MEKYQVAIRNEYEEVEDKVKKSEKSPVEDISADLKEENSFYLPILANMYDQISMKIAKLEDKNAKFTEKNEKAKVKIEKSNSFIELFNQIKEPKVAKAIPDPIFKFLEKIAEQKQEKIASLNNKIEKRNNKIASNNKKIKKNKTKLEICKKIDKFLHNMKSPKGRKENFINGLQEFNTLALNKATNKLADINDKIAKASTAYEKTHSASDRLKLRNKIKKLTEQKGVIEGKIQDLGRISDRINAIQTASRDKVDEVISKSYDGIENDVTKNPDGFVKNQAETVVEVCNTVIDKELLSVDLKLEQDKPDNNFKIDPVINNDSKEKLTEKDIGVARSEYKDNVSEIGIKNLKNADISFTAVKDSKNKGCFIIKYKKSDSDNVQQILDRSLKNSLKR